MIQTFTKNIKLLLISGFTALALVVAGSATVNAQGTPNTGATTDTKGAARCGSEIQLDATGCAVDAGATGTGGIEELIRKVINFASALVGAIAVIMIIIGGFRYVTSGGDSNNVGAAKNTIIYAIVGLLIVAFAQIIVKFVLGSTTS